MFAIFVVASLLLFALACGYVKNEQWRHTNIAIDQAQRWRGRFWPVFWLGIAVLLVSWSVVYQFAGMSRQENHSRQYSSPISNTGYRLIISYPPVIRFDPSTKDANGLIAWIEPVTAVTTPLTLTLDLKSDNQHHHGSTIIFTDDAGAIVRPQMILRGERIPVPQQLFIQPSPHSGSTIPISVILGIPQMPGIALAPLQVSVESWEEAQWRLAWARVFGDLTLPLAIASAVLGIGSQLLNQETQRTEEMQRSRLEQRQARVREARELFDRDPVEGRRTLMKLEEEVRRPKDDWDHQVVRELGIVRENQDQQLTNVSSDHRIGRLLGEAPQYYRGRDFERFLTALELIERACANNSGKQQAIETLRMELAFSRDPANSSPSVDQLRPVALKLYEQFGPDAYELVIMLFEELVARTKETPEFELFQTMIVDSEQRDTFNQLLLADPRIRVHIKSLREWTYDWPRLQYKDKTSVQSPQIAEWLKTQGFTSNPFDPRDVQDRSKFWEKLSLPREKRREISGNDLRDHMIAARPLLSSGREFDRWIAATALYLEVSKTRSLKGMPVMLRVPNQFAATMNASDMLAMTTRLVGDTWIRILPAHPGALLALPQVEQEALVEWLVWAAGSQRALRLRIQTKDMADTHSLVLTRYVDHLLQNTPIPIMPHANTMLDWLTIRPPDIHYTYLMVLDATNSASVGEFGYLAETLYRIGVICKLFVSPDCVENANTIPHVKLAWSAKELHDMMEVSISAAEGQPRKLTDLIGVGDPQHTEQLLKELFKHADGSFELALRLCNQALLNHLQRMHEEQIEPDINDRGYLELSEADIRSALSVV